MRQVAHAAEPGLDREAGVDSKDEVHIFGEGKTYMRKGKDEEAQQVPVKLKIMVLFDIRSRLCQIFDLMSLVCVLEIHRYWLQLWKGWLQMHHLTFRTGSLGLVQKR